MKSALILEKDPASDCHVSRQLRLLGYITAPVRTPEEALNVASAINFDVIVTFTAIIPGDRRSLTGELKRAAPEAAIILVIEDRDNDASLQILDYPGASVVFKRPPAFDVIRRCLEYGIDGYGMQPACLPQSLERRRQRVQYTKSSDLQNG